MARETFEDRIVSAGYTTGFDYLRIGLAFAVVLWHSIRTSGDQAVGAIALGPLIGPLQAMVLPMFFALSGFLVSGSVQRSRTITGFVTLRVIRILPALAVEVLLSALILGPIFTKLPAQHYFTDPDFFTYFANIVGDIHYHLPGVFESNPVPGIVNMSLWTVPFELECYLVLVAITLAGIFYRPMLFAGLTLALIVAATLVLIGKTGGIGMPGKLNGRILVLAFLCGNVLYVFRDRIPNSSALGVASLIASFALLSYPPTRPLCVIPASYLTVWLGLKTPPKIMGGDYSYGVYLFAFPLQQVLALQPSLNRWWLNFALIVPISLTYAAFSWHCVEKPILDRKRLVVSFVESRTAAWRSAGHGLLLRWAPWAAAPARAPESPAPRPAR